MKNYLFLFLFVISLNNCFANRLIQPTKYEDQDEVLVDGASVLVSTKTNAVSMYQTSEKLQNRRGNFYFSILNATERPVNFRFSDLKVTDQVGREVKIAHKKELIADKRSQKNWSLVASALCAGLESVNAHDAGKIKYTSHTSSHHQARGHVVGSNGWASGAVSSSTHTTTHGTVHSEALRQQAIRRVHEDANNRSNYIQASYKDWEYRLNNFYFDSNTIFPGDSYSANFQVVVDDKIEKELEYLLFTYDLGGEEHTFSYHCGER